MIVLSSTEVERILLPENFRRALPKQHRGHTDNRRVIPRRVETSGPHETGAHADERFASAKGSRSRATIVAADESNMVSRAAPPTGRSVYAKRLAKEQLPIQSAKVTVRDLKEYENLALRAESYYLDDLENPDTRGGVREAIFEHFGLGDWRSRFPEGQLMIAVLKAIAKARGGQVHWVDAMAGHAAAQRQAAHEPSPTFSATPPRRDYPSQRT
jgi:hypothetical protein